MSAPGPVARGAAHSVVVEEPDPAAAIRLAIRAAGTEGSVYWAGPGLTDHRDVAGRHVPYSSFDDARAALREAGHGAADPEPRLRQRKPNAARVVHN